MSYFCFLPYDRMKQLLKFRSIYLSNGFLTAAMFFTITWKTPAYSVHSSGFRTTLTAPTDTTILPTTDSSRGTLPTIRDTTGIPGRDSSLIVRVDTFSLKLSKDSLDAPLIYEAEDSVVVQVQNKKILLYGKTKTTYKDILLTAPKVEMDQQTQIVTAYNLKDTTGAIIENANFKDGNNQFTSDTIRYNFKSQVGLTKNTYTQDGEIVIHGDVAKKVNENTTFIKRARFTTCDLDDPHFAFVTNKMKVINKKLAVSGPAHPEFEGVPVPIYIPFGFYPLSQGRHSGLIPPQFTTNEEYGLGLEGLGYYKVLSDYWDVKLYGNIYSYGGWSAHLNPTYRRRYRYNGTLTASIQSTKLNFKGDPDFLSNKSYFLSWSHAVDSRARPGTTFSASVNAGSTRYNRLVPNNTQLNFQNQLGSSIAYSKSWQGKPYNLTLTANHNQNNLTHLINVSLPSAAFTVSTIYPFQGKDFVGTPKWYQKLGIGYTGNFLDRISFYDTAATFKNIFETLQWGAQHIVPITLSLPPLFGGALIVSPSVSYSEVWLNQKSRRIWDTAAKKVDTTITKGFFADRQTSFSLGFNTAVFGTYQFKKSRIIAIRHVIRPSLSVSYRPDLSKKHYYDLQIDTTTYRQRVNEFDRPLFIPYSEGRFGGLGFSLDNNVEMKWRSKKDTGTESIKKIKLIDGYGLTTGYNFFGDSLKLSPVQLYFRTTLFEKVSISARTTLDPYQFNERGNPIDKYAWQDGKFKLGRLTNGSVSLTTSLRSKPKDAKKEEERKRLTEEQLGDLSLIADQQRLLDYMQQNPAEFVDFNIPWQVSLSFSLYFNSTFNQTTQLFEKTFNTNINFSGSFSLTPKWNFSSNGYYDFKTHKLQTFQMSINREMHCWQLAINVTPIGLYRSFSFTISPKASVLQDLRINRSRFFTGF